MAQTLLLKKTSDFQIAAKAMTNYMQETRAPQTKHHKQIKKKRVFEPVSGNCNKRKAEVQVLTLDKVELKEKALNKRVRCTFYTVMVTVLSDSPLF